MRTRHPLGTIQMVGATAATVLLLVTVLSCGGEGLQAVPPVPDSIANPVLKQALLQKQAELTQMKTTLEKRLASFQARSKNVPAEQETAILEERRQIADALTAYSKRIQRFGAELRRDLRGALAGTVRMKGDVSVQNEDGTWRPLKPGEVVLGSTPLKTGANGSIELDFDDHIQRIGPNSSLILEPDPLQDSGLSALMDGLAEWRSKAAFKADQFLHRRRVRTPRAILAVRGTQFIVRHEASSGLTVAHLKSGELDVTPHNASKPIRLSAGVTISIHEDGTLAIATLTDEVWQLAQQNLLEPTAP